MRGLPGGQGGVSAPSTSSSTKPTPSGRDSKRRSSTKTRRNRETRSASPSHRKGARNPDGIDSTPAGIKEAHEIQRGLSSMATGGGKDLNQAILELKPIGVYEESRLGIFEHSNPGKVKRELKVGFSADLADSIYIRRAER